MATVKLYQSWLALGRKAVANSVPLGMQEFPWMKSPSTANAFTVPLEKGTFDRVLSLIEDDEDDWWRPR